MDELTIDDKKYLSSRQAAKITGYAKDYVGQLCREGRVDARLVGRNWYVLEESILEHRFGPAETSQEDPEPVPPASSSWESPIYKPEEVVPLSEMPKKVLQEQNVPIREAVADSTLADMQSAWQDWFKSKEVETPSTGELLLEESYDHPEIEEIEPETVHIERIHEEREPTEAQIVEEAIPVRIIKQKEERLPVVSSPRTPTPMRTHRSQPVDRQVSKKKQGGVIQNAIMASLVVLVVALTIIGSGMADRYLGKKNFVSPVTDFIGGISTVESNK